MAVVSDMNLTLDRDCRLLRVRDVAAHLSISRSTVYELMTSGRLGFVKIGKARRVPIDAVEKLVRDNAVETE